MSAAEKAKSVVCSTKEAFEHLWNNEAPSSLGNEVELLKQEIVSEDEKNFDCLLPQYESYTSIKSEDSMALNDSCIHEEAASTQTSYLIQSSPTTAMISLDSATSCAIQSLINDACQKAVEKVEESNKLILIRLTEEIQRLRKDVGELKKAVSPNNSTILPSKPFSNVDDFLQFEKTVQEDTDNFSLLIADLKRLSTSNSRKFVTKSWQKLMEDTVAESFSWRGTAEKKGIRAFTVTTAIRQTFICENGGKEEDFVFASKSFFQYAKNRIKIKTTKQSAI